MVEESALTQLFETAEALIHNTQQLPFLLSSKAYHRPKGRGGRERPQTRYIVTLRTKRYPDSPDCEVSICECEDLLCKCAWDVQLEVAGAWGSTLLETLRSGIVTANKYGRCSSCQTLTPWTTTARCPSCTLLDLVTSFKLSECPICQDNVPSSHQIPLRCGHLLCSPCALKLYRTSKDVVKCPCCRKEEAKSSFATHLAPCPTTDFA